MEHVSVWIFQNFPRVYSGIDCAFTVLVIVFVIKAVCGLVFYCGFTLCRFLCKIPGSQEHECSLSNWVEMIECLSVPVLHTWDCYQSSHLKQESKETYFPNLSELFLKVKHWRSSMEKSHLKPVYLLRARPWQRPFTLHRLWRQLQPQVLWTTWWCVFGSMFVCVLTLGALQGTIDLFTCALLTVSH